MAEIKGHNSLAIGFSESEVSSKYRRCWDFIFLVRPRDLDPIWVSQIAHAAALVTWFRGTFSVVLHLRDSTATTNPSD